MSDKLTPWFSYHVKPVHIGYYETLTSWTQMVLYWNGAAWKASEHSPKHAPRFDHMRDWRGLVSDPKAKP